MGQKGLKIIGLMSGTSCDGVSACLVEIKGWGLNTRVELLAHETHPYEPPLRETLLELGGSLSTPIERLSWLNILLGSRLARSARAVASLAGIPLGEVDLIGSHGHTILHCPRPQDFDGKKLSTTLQVGEPSIIAQETGVTTVADFRMADVAAGGSGAPLVPYVDYLLFRDKEKGRAIQNIGGIANVTFLPPGADLQDIIAFDTGPGNMPIDHITELITRGGLKFDEGGELARKGKVNEQLLSQLMEHPYLGKGPPKSTGREEFGKAFTDRLYKDSNPGDGLSLLATLTAFTARSVAESYKSFIMPHHTIDEVILTGGGSKNNTLVEFLRGLLYPVPMRMIEEFGIPSQAKEALSFAVLANEALRGNPSNVPVATGAREPAILGKFVPGRNWRNILRVMAS